MQNRRAMTLGEYSSVHHSRFLSLSRALLSAATLEDFIRQLNELDGGFVKGTRVNLILKAGEGASVYFMGERGPATVRWPQACACLSREPSLVQSATRFHHPCAGLVGEGIYEGLRLYCRLPVTTARGQLGWVEFMHHGVERLTLEEQGTLTELAAIIAIALENLLDKASTLAQTRSLRLERDSCKILVDVTNTVISQLHIAGLSKSLFDVLQQHLAINSLCLVTHQSSADCFRSYLINSSQHEQEILDHHCVAPCCLQRAQHQQEPFFIERQQGTDCHARCHFTARLLPADAACSCLLPLRYRDQRLGVLILSHPDATVFADLDLSLLAQVAARTAIAINNVQAQQEISHLNEVRHKRIPIVDLPPEPAFHHIISQSAVMGRVLEQVRLVAESDSTVLILGETGTGKELIAQAIHQLSARREQQMVKVNCAAIPGGLIESDLFGHEKGAFTGASSQRQGRFERANKGTLFLDEVGDMPLDLQPKLLRVLQERELERVGSSRPVAVDVRLVAATNCDLLAMVREKRFRSDLYYRLNVFPIELPPLRERREDIPLLVNFLIKKIARRMRRTITAMSADTMQMLVSLPWHGNIRELENVIERAVVMTRGHQLNLTPDDLRPLKDYPQPEPPPRKAVPPHRQADPDEERRGIVAALRECNGIVAGERGAASLLGIKRTTLLSRMKRLGISAKELLTSNQGAE